MNWKKLPLWLRSGTLTAAVIIILETLYVTAVLTKTTAVFTIFPFHVALLFPIMVTVGLFGSPEFLVKNVIPPTGGLFLIILFWFILGALVGLIIKALKPHYYSPEFKKDHK